MKYESLINKFLLFNPEWDRVVVEDNIQDVIFFRHNSSEPFSKEEFLTGSPTRSAMEKLVKKLKECQEILDVLNAVDSGEIKIINQSNCPHLQYCGHIRYRLSNDWVIFVFNDCNAFDYIDSIERADQSEIDWELLHALDEWQPKHPEMWGFPQAS